MRTLAIVLGTAYVVLAAAPPASAHAILISSSPQDGAQLASAPTKVVLRFDENVSLVPHTARVLSGTGAYVDDDTATGSGKVVTIPLQTKVPSGQYAATYRVISADGHVVAGSIRFGVAVPAGAPLAPATTTSRGLDLLFDVGTGLGTALLVLVIGVPLSLRLLGLRHADGLPRLLVLGATGVSLVAALLALWADRSRATGASGLVLSAITSAGSAGWTHTDQMLALRAAMLAALPALAGLRGPAITQALQAIAGFDLVLSHAWFGHAYVGSWSWLAAASAMLHVVAMTIWLGGLVVLLLICLGSRLASVDVPALDLRRWPPIAATCVVVLIVTGTVQALRQVDPLGSLLHTRYGLVFLAKIALVAVTLLVALLSRRALGTLVSTETGVVASPLRRRLATRVGAEVACLAGVLALTGVLVTEPPARDTYGPSVTLSAPLGPDHLDVRVSSTRRGEQTITVTRRSAAGRALPLRELDGRLTLTSGRAAAIDVTFRVTTDGSWRSTNAVAPLPGRWRLDLSAEIDQATAYATVVAYRVW